MRKTFLFLVMIACLPGIALADLDYRCLSDCKNDGKQTQDCIKECTYSSSVAPKPKKGLGAAHKELKAPVPVGAQTIILKPKAVSSPNATPDYTCLSACMRDGMQYALCNERCRKTD
jgi:hypothetical protein